MLAPLAVVEELSDPEEEIKKGAGERGAAQHSGTRQKLRSRTTSRNNSEDPHIKDAAADGTNARESVSDVFLVDAPDAHRAASNAKSSRHNSNHVVLVHLRTQSKSGVQTYVVPPVRSSSCLSGESSGVFCRICHEGEGKEDLISPCKCAGTMGLIHLSCVEKWLSQAGSSRCEICGFEYVTEKTPRPLTEWLKTPSRPNDRRNFYGDLACFLVLTPLAGVSTWLCITGAAHYAQYEKTKWETAGLITLAVFLLLIYFVWCMVASRYHLRVIRDWKAANQIVRIIPRDTDATQPRDQNNNEHPPGLHQPTNESVAAIGVHTSSPNRRLSVFSDGPIAASSPVQQEASFPNATPRSEMTSSCRYCANTGVTGNRRAAWFPGLPTRHQSYSPNANHEASFASDGVQRYASRFQGNRVGSLPRCLGRNPGDGGRGRYTRARSSLSESALPNDAEVASPAQSMALQCIKETYV